MIPELCHYIIGFMADFVSLVPDTVKTRTDILNYIDKHVRDSHRIWRMIAEGEKPSWRELVSEFIDVGKIDRLYDIYEEKKDLHWEFYLLIRQRYGDTDHILIELDVINERYVSMFTSKDHLSFMNMICPPTPEDDRRPTNAQLRDALCTDGYRVPPALVSLCRSFVYDNLEVYRKTIDHLKLNSIADMDFFQYLDLHTNEHVQCNDRSYRWISL